MWESSRVQVECSSLAFRIYVGHFLAPGALRVCRYTSPRGKEHYISNNNNNNNACAHNIILYYNPILFPNAQRVSNGLWSDGDLTSGSNSVRKIIILSFINHHIIIIIMRTKFAHFPFGRISSLTITTMWICCVRISFVVTEWAETICFAKY